MQQKEIRYTGITTIPSDYDCPDGDIASMMNLVNEKGNLVPATPPKVLFKLESGQKVMYIHKTSNYCNYITFDINSKKVYYFTKDPTEIKDINTLKNSELYQINSIGNTLIILTDQGLIYAIFTSGNYEILGSNPPFPSISFRLKGGVGKIKSFTVKFKEKTKLYTEITSGDPLAYKMLNKLFLDNPTTSDAIYANINTDAQSIKSQNAFQYDFMIRYAYRLYDGSLYMCSVPIYINAGNGTPYFLQVTDAHSVVSDDGSDHIGKYVQIRDIGIDLYRLASHLYYQITNVDEVSKELSKWKDIIKEISFFVTPSLFYMDQNHQPSTTITGQLPDPLTVGQYDSGFTMSMGGKDANGVEVYLNRSYPHSFWTDGKRVIPLLISINGGDGLFIFRHIASIDLKSIQSGEKLLQVEEGALTTLDNRERMSGDSNVSQKLVARKSFVYNSCLNLINVSAIPPEFPLESCVIYTNGKIIESQYIVETYSFKAYVLIKSSNTSVLIIETSSINLYSLGDYFFYPNVDAFKVIIERTDKIGNKSYTSNDLKEHDSINGVYTDRLSGVYVESIDLSILESTDRGFYYPSKIYTSEVNNPFSFPATGVNTVGSGEISGIRSATKALSQGQFGQFPLYAFTDEGIWALEVSSEGKFIAKQPATRDVCNNPDSITQIDTAVLFTSERGIMLIQGSESICISEVLNEKSFDISTLKGYDQLIQMTDLTVEHFKHSNFIEYIKRCAMSYDYTNQRIIVFNKEYSYAYVFSLQSKTWGMIPSDFTNPVNSYPDSYIMTKNNTLVNISNTGNENSKDVKGIIITRPLKLDSPDLLKTITQSIHRGVFRKGKVKTVLYGSRDCINFVPITSSLDHTLCSVHGSPYKYFRFAIIAELSPGESISGTSIIYETRQTNKLR